MTTMRRQRPEGESTDQPENILDAPPATDWRRMPDEEHNSIARRAYELYEKRGREPGHELDDWLQAEHELQPRRSAEGL